MSPKPRVCSFVQQHNTLFPSALLGIVQARLHQFKLLSTSKLCGIRANCMSWLKQWRFCGRLILASGGKTINKTTCWCTVTRREVNEARRRPICSRPCSFEEKKRKKEKKNPENPPHPKHTTKSTAARRPRRPRDGVPRNTSHALARTRPLPWIPGLWKSALYSSRNQ